MRAYLLVPFLLLACTKAKQEVPVLKDPIDLGQILDRGYITAITGYSATTYFIYKGQTMGYEYEFLVDLAEDLELELRMVVTRNMDSIFAMLNRGEGDLAAGNLTVTKDRARSVAFTDHLLTTRQVLVQLKPQNWRQMKLHEIEKRLIRSPVELLDPPEVGHLEEG